MTVYEHLMHCSCHYPSHDTGVIFQQATRTTSALLFWTGGSADHVRIAGKERSAVCLTHLQTMMFES